MGAQRWQEFNIDEPAFTLNLNFDRSYPPATSVPVRDLAQRSGRDSGPAIRLKRPTISGSRGTSLTIRWRSSGITGVASSPVAFL